MMTSSKPVLAISAVAPIVLLIIMVAFLLGPASSFLQFGIVLPEVSIEKIEFTGNEIQATVRNTGPVSVNVVLADVNDRIQPAAIEPDTSLERFETALVRIPGASHGIANKPSNLIAKIASILAWFEKYRD